MISRGRLLSRGQQTAIDRRNAELETCPVDCNGYPVDDERVALPRGTDLDPSSVKLDAAVGDLCMRLSEPLPGCGLTMA
jgi:hypothetical protein